jgi:hypothetical protein
MFEFTVTLRLRRGASLWLPSQVLSGLADLEAERTIALQTDLTAPDDSHEAMIWLDVQRLGGAQSFRIAIDLADSATAFSQVGLQEADLYLKRHFVADSVAAMPETVRSKIRPYGLWMPCLSRSARARFLAASMKLALLEFARPIGALRLLKENASSFRGLPTPTAIAADPGRPRESLVVFQTRLWPPSENSAAKDVDKVNAERAEMVRALRRALGNRFIGGIVADAFSRSFCPDAVVAEGTNRRAYVQLTHRAAVGVFTRGLHHTLGFRLPEYLGAGVAIVSEPIDDELLAPLEENRHYRAYRTMDECVAACDHLLSHPGESARMRDENARYFRLHCDPKAQIAQALRQTPG